MSELDYELAEVSSPDIVELFQTEKKAVNEAVACEVPSNEPSTMVCPEIIDLSSDEDEVDTLNAKKRSVPSDLVEIRSPEVIKVKAEESGMKKTEIEISNDCNKSVSDLEEGEIKETTDDSINDNSKICRHLLNGKCFLGKNCNLLHIGVSSYKMFENEKKIEIKKPVDDSINGNIGICRHFLKGKCFMGNNCNFLHIGVSSYNVFNSNVINPSFLFSKSIPILPMLPGVIVQPSEEPISDSWEKGLKEAKKLLSLAKLKKESDLDFEVKQLYQDLDEEDIDLRKRKLYLSDKLKKRKVTSERYLPQKNLERNYKNQELPETLSKETLKQRSHEKRKSRTKCRSNSSSPIPYHHRPNRSRNSSSSCSDCAHFRHKSLMDYRKSRSKLERVFSRALDTPETSRSKKPYTSSRTFSSNPRRRSLSRHSFIKRFIYRSYSKSPSPSKNPYNKRHSDKNNLNEPSTSPFKIRRKGTSLYSNNERNSSPFSKLLSQNNTSVLKSCSSDLTVSSIKCTSLSCTSSEKNDASKQSKSPVIASKRMLNLNSDVKCKEGGSSKIVKKWLDTVPKSIKSRESDTVETQVKNIEKSTRPFENGKTSSLLSRKKSSRNVSNDEDELSADELELLRYIPSKNSKREKNDKKSVCNEKVTKQITEPITKHLPPVIAYDEESDSKSVLSNVVHDHGSNEESLILNVPFVSRKNNSNNESVDPEETKSASSNKCNNIANENGLPTEICYDADEAISTTDENGIHLNINSSRPNNSKKRRLSESSSPERPLSPGAMELLKYVTVRDPDMLEKIRKQASKIPSQKAVKKTLCKAVSKKAVPLESSSLKSSRRKKIKTNGISRREQLMKQLEAVEKAIAKKRQQLSEEFINDTTI